MSRSVSSIRVESSRSRAVRSQSISLSLLSCLEHVRLRFGGCLANERRPGAYVSGSKGKSCRREQVDPFQMLITYRATAKQEEQSCLDHEDHSDLGRISSWHLHEDDLILPYGSIVSDPQVCCISVYSYGPSESSSANM